MNRDIATLLNQIDGKGYDLKIFEFLFEEKINGEKEGEAE